MTLDALAALLLFAFVTSVTPGPNNLMLMASGANFGLRRTVPHMLGIGIGFTVMIVGVGLGLAGVFAVYPVLKTVLLAVSLVYLAWLAWRIATAAAPDGRDSGARPLSFWQAAAFQWVNVKAWAMALSAVTVYAPDGKPATVALVAAAFGAVNLPCVSAWALIGREIRRVLSTPGRLRLFNAVMAVLLVASTVPVVLS